MNLFHTLFLYIDAFLIYFYRLTEIPILGYFGGTFILALFCVITGQITLYAACRWNRRWLNRDSRQMVKMHNLSLRALAAKDKKAYKACNKEANDAFGKYFFSQMALGMSSLWPAPFALAWMGTRFAEVEFLLPGHLPFIGNSVGYTFTFIPLYVLMYMLFGKLRHRLPWFREMAELLKRDVPGEEMMTLGDLVDRNCPAVQPLPYEK